MKNSKEVTRLKILLFITLGLFVGSWFWFIIQNAKPKSVVDIVNKMVSEETIADLSYAEGAGSEEDLILLQDYRFGQDNVFYNQYFVLDKDGEDILLVETTSGLVNNELQIKSVKEIDRSIYEDELH